VNLISTVEGVARQLEGKGAILSLDLFKAYERVNLSYFQSVMEAMNKNIPDVFIYWVLMLHDGARLILFLLHVEPLLLHMQDVTKGVSLTASQVRDVQTTDFFFFF
jgi:hypothetical protein